jgi:hypothetical protein
LAFFVSSVSNNNALAAVVGRDPLAEANEIVRRLSTHREHVSSKPLAIDRMVRTHDAPQAKVGLTNAASLARRLNLADRQCRLPSRTSVGS